VPVRLDFKKDAIDDEISQFRHVVLTDFRNEDFTALETLSSQLIAEKARFKNGSWKIFQFHSALKLAKNASDGSWNGWKARIQRWENQYPQSVTARIAEIMFLTDYAWNARGGEYVDKVKESAWPIFNNRLAEAHKVLDAAGKLTQKSPMLWSAGLVVAVGQGWPKDETVRFYNEGKIFEPEFWNLDINISYYLLPRWYGEGEEWERFAQREIERKGGLGAEGYARTVFATGSCYYKNIFQECHANWELLKKGFAQMHDHYPESKQILDEYAFLAVQAGDRNLARRIFKDLNGEGDPAVWRTEEYFRSCVLWANEVAK
jgi:hypothetical protein